MSTQSSHPSVPPWQKAIVILTGFVVAVASVAILQWGRPVFVPISGAVLLALLLSPIVRRLRRLGLDRVSAVLLSVLTVGILVLALGGVMISQVGQLLTEIPRNTATIRAKIQSLKQLGSGTATKQFSQMLEEINEEFSPKSSETDDAPTVAQSPEADISTTAGSHPTPKAPWLLVTGYLESVFEVLGSLAFALVLIVFFLLEREDLRDRIVLLAGKARLSLTSKALEDITTRISRYLLMVAAVNGGFGLCLSIGLLLLGVPYAVLWGVLAAVLRFLPYIGPWVGAIFPIVMSLALSPGWWQPLGVITFVLVLELVCNNAVEPFLFGRTTGVSPTALLISAAFWLYVWGPLGLVLSAPFAVCLVVVGKNVPQLSFLNLLMGDQPAFSPAMSYYQRLMLGNEYEAQQLAKTALEKISLTELCDEILVPTLSFAKQDARRHLITEEDYQTVWRGVRSDLHLATSTSNEDVAETRESLSDKPPVRLLCCCAEDESDLVAIEMLNQQLDPQRWSMQVAPIESLTSEVVQGLESDPPDMFFIAAVPPGGLAPARYLCKRLHAVDTNLPIVVGRWRTHKTSARERHRLESAGASFVTATLRETCQLLEARWPLLVDRIKGRRINRSTASAESNYRESLGFSPHCQTVDLGASLLGLTPGQKPESRHEKCISPGNRRRRPQRTFSLSGSPANTTTTSEY